MSIKHAFKQMALRAGVEIRRFNAAESSDARLTHQLARHDVNLVLDVGANDGGYGRLLRAAGYGREILSFEPLTVAHAELMQNVAGDDAWHVAPRMALGEEHGEVSINIAGNSTSSSVLPMGQLHADAAPASQYCGQETVSLRRLDCIEHDSLERASSVLLKIDTQGYEMAVLRGASGMLHAVRGVQVELSVTALYEGQALYSEVMTYLEALGFELWNLAPGFVDPRSGRMLQFDGVFFRA